MKVIWTEQAMLRLSAIEDHIAEDNPAAAARFIERLIERGEDLAKFPSLGRLVPEMPRGQLRELIEGNHRIVCRVHRKSVEILTVFEGHRLLDPKELPAERPIEEETVAPAS